MRAQQIIDAAYAEASAYTYDNPRTAALDYTSDGERILVAHVQRVLDEIETISVTRLLAFQQAEARVGVLHEALSWILLRAKACVTGHQSAICSIQDRAQAALDAVADSEAGR